MNIIWGLIIAMGGALFITWGRTRSDFGLYRLLVARSRVLWGDRVHTASTRSSAPRDHRRCGHCSDRLSVPPMASVSLRRVDSSGRRSGRAWRFRPGSALCHKSRRPHPRRLRPATQLMEPLYASADVSAIDAVDIDEPCPADKREAPNR